MNRSIPSKRTVSAIARVAAALIMMVTMMPAYAVQAQDADAIEVPPSLIEVLANAPRSTSAIVGQNSVAPDEVGSAEMTDEALAQLPDRTQFAVIDYSVDGTLVNATVQLPVSQSTYIASGLPGSNFSNESFINLGWNQNTLNAMRMLLQYDLGPLPANPQINNASFFINQSQITPSGDGQSMDFRAQLMQQSWNQGSVTWNNANFLGGAEFPLGSIPPAIGWVSGPATNVVRGWVTGEPNRGIIITGDETPGRGRWRQFWSRQISSLAPYLEVTFTANCDTAPPVATMNALPTFSPSEFRVFWSAFDPAQPGCPASGVAWFNVRYRINGGSWVNWRNRTETDSFTFRGWAPNNALVEYQVQASDRAGNIGAWSPIVSTRIDSEPPVASVNPLPQYTIFPAFTVTWSGVDNLSGIASYNLQMNINDGGWFDVLTETTATSFQVTGAQFRDLYKFRVQAIDNVGNAQAWSPNAQASTTVFDHPVARTLPFDPAIVQSTSPVTDVVTVSWQGFFAPGTTINSYEVRYRFTGFGSASGPWISWTTFPGTTTSADFTPELGNGIYEFFVIATNNLGQVQPFEPQSGLGASVIVDLEDTIQPRAYMPIIARQAAD
ncbi:MAG: DNRLRE domain-containing protein [Caldilinea sp.]